uniref:Uncharacterized protein n=1 Tax=Ditylenchus dipsaci TaxID=166011 RepID=A0A915CMM1_9BILA
MANWLTQRFSNILFLINSLFTAFCFNFLSYSWHQKKCIKGKLVLITGAGGAIGRELAKEFARLGANLLLWDVVQAANLETADLCNQLGVQAFCQTVDVGDRQAIYTAAHNIQKDTDGNFAADDVDIVVNNAGIISSGSFLETEDELIEKLLRVNLFHSFWTTKVFLPKMLERGSGHIVVTASACSFYGVPGLVDYAASKAAVFNFMEGLQNEINHLHPEKDIHFTCLCPSFVATPLVKDVRKAVSSNFLLPEAVAKKANNCFKRNSTFEHVQKLINKSPCNDEVASFAALKRFHKLIQLSKQKQCVIQGLDQKHPLLTGSINSAIQKWHDSWPLEYDEEVDDLALNVTKNLEAVCRDSEELYLLPSTFDGKYFVDSFVEFVPAGFVSFYPKCQYSTLSPILHKNLTSSAKVLTASKEMHGQDNQLLANVGCQFTANFIHEKFQRSMAVNDRSWMACKMKDTRCLLVTSSGYAVASSDKSTKWRDYQEECLMPKSDGRQQFQGNTAMAAPAAAGRNTGFHDVLSAMQFLGNKMAGLAASLMWFEFSIFIRQSFEQSSYLKVECDFENLEMVEQCAMEHTHYNLNVDQTVTLKAVLRTGCFGNLTISPASDTGLNLFPTFFSYQIPDCNMTTPKYRKPRSDLDYTTSHPQESINLCSSAPLSCSAGEYKKKFQMVVQGVIKAAEENST